MILVSTVIPVYNGASTIRAAIESALSQNVRDHEIIVVNDGSTDGTEIVLTEFHDRIIVINQQNSGLSAARNAGIAAARGEYVALLDADDESRPDRIEKSLAVLSGTPSSVLVFSDYARVNSEGEILYPTTVPPNRAHAPTLTELLENWWPIAPSTVTMTRQAFIQSGRFDAQLKAFEDIDFFLRMRELGEFAYIPEALVRYRVNETTGPFKWNPDRFIRTVKRRYGARSRKLIQEIHVGLAGAFVSRALDEMESCNRKEAIRCWLKAFRYRPQLVFQAFHPALIARPQNLRRVANMIKFSTSRRRDVERA
jgi:glycosyltransferase involved in cell wall biosynthesis